MLICDYGVVVKVKCCIMECDFYFCCWGFGFIVIEKKKLKFDGKFDKYGCVNENIFVVWKVSY